MNPWRDDPEGDARFNAVVQRIDTALAAPPRTIMRSALSVPNDILVVSLGLLLLALAQAATLSVLL